MGMAYGYGMAQHRRLFECAEGDNAIVSLCSFNIALKVTKERLSRSKVKTALFADEGSDGDSA